MINFSEKTVLVTGGGVGIGRAIALGFGASGAKVVIAEKDQARADAVEAELRAQDIQSLVVVADVTVKADVEHLHDRVAEKFGGLDVLVNNVGDFLGMVKPFAEMNDEEIDQQYGVNLKHIFLVTRAMIPLLRKNGPGGSIISVSSIEGFRGIPNGTVYATFKAAVTGFTKSLALELAPEGLRVNLIAPESTETPQLPISLAIPKEHHHHMDRWIPLGRFGQPEDMAGAALYLASPLAAWVTGTTIHVDGGALAASGWYRAPDGSWTNLPLISGNPLSMS